MSPEQPAKPRVCVIGAGLSGLVTTKELREQGVEAECYDMMPLVGGTFASFTWKGGCLTSSTCNTWFSDFPVEDRQAFMTWEEFVAYLERYVEHFGFGERVHLDTKAVEITREGEGWRVRFRQADHSNGHYSHPKGRAVEVREFEERFTHLVLSTGLNQSPRVPELPGLDGFAGQVLHSSEYRDAEDFRGKRVVVVGAGESASDIAAQVSQVAAASVVSMRTAPGTLFPKWIQGNTPDIRDDRLTYNLPRTLHPVILNGHRRFYSIQTETPELFEFARDMNYENERCAFNSNACKSFGIPEAVVHHGAALRSEIASIDGSAVQFSDGERFEADAIIFGTGFEMCLPLLDPALAERFVAVDHLWKNAVDPELGERLMIVGYARAHHINQLTTAEMQARMVALVISGQRELPSPEAMRETIAADRAFMQRYYGERYAKNPALVDQLYFTDSLAKFIGCEVPWARAFAKDPILGMKLIYGALNGAHHRLAGPGAKWEVAAKAIKATPLFNNKPNAMLRWSVLSVLTGVAKVVGLVRPEARTISTQARA